ncbi:DUF5634 family protein [Anaerobacillus sp. MEB173]|uniref:DUF5634 family protein n=1 Tax=Anaerobacillus sp. MEB173 TaxID=3383345 RepID=UPI003F935D54
MEFLPRESVIREMNRSLHSMIEKYDLEDIGVFEEEGEGNNYHLGYTIRKNGEVYMVHQPYEKNNQGELTPVNREWVIESDAGDTRGYQSLNEVIQYISNHHSVH